MLRNIFSVTLLAALFSLSACSMLTGKNGYFRDRTQNYVNADSAAPLKFPADASPKGINSLYPVPDHSSPNKKPVSLLPPDLSK